MITPITNCSVILLVRIVHTLVLRHLKFGLFRIGAFCRSYPWLDEKFCHEGIEVHGHLESVRLEARRARYSKTPMCYPAHGNLLLAITLLIQENKLYQLDTE